jgi:hypothetical protein
VSRLRSVTILALKSLVATVACTVILFFATVVIEGRSRLYACDGLLLIILLAGVVAGITIAKMLRPVWLAVAVVVASLCVFLVPRPIHDLERWQCQENHMLLIGHALRDHADCYGRLPSSAGALPAILPRPKDDSLLYSWRVALLPFIEEDALYKKLRRKEPWDSAHNKPLLAEVPRYYRVRFGEFDPPGVTHCQVFVGPGTAFEREGITLQDFPDGLANTILVVEATNAVPWAKPGDLAYNPDQPLPPLGGNYTKPVDFLCWTVTNQEGFTAAFADGSSRFISSKTDERVLRALITRNGKD